MQKFIETEKKMMHNFLNKECDKKMIKARNQKGFTLVEVFVVIIILGSFALAAIYTVWNTHQLVITVEEQCQVNTKVIHVNDPPVLKSLNYYE